MSLIQTGTGQRGRVERCPEGSREPGDPSDHVRGDGAEARRPDNGSPLPAAGLRPPAAFWERYMQAWLMTYLMNLLLLLFLRNLQNPQS